MTKNRPQIGIEILDLSVPTGVYSDLENANLTESVLFSYNDIKLRWIAGENWTYSLKFEMTSQDLFHKFVILTFNGLDTLTEIFLNGESIGTTDNMFVRYRFNVKEILIAVSTYEKRDSQRRYNVKFSGFKRADD